MSRSIFSPPPCDCCGAEYRNSGCVRGYGCQCSSFHDYCEVCKFCGKHCLCNDEMKAEHAVALGDYHERLRVIQAAHSNLVNIRRLG
jgi:hypothetical protein